MAAKSPAGAAARPEGFKTPPELRQAFNRQTQAPNVIAGGPQATDMTRAGARRMPAEIRGAGHRHARGTRVQNVATRPAGSCGVPRHLASGRCAAAV